MNELIKIENKGGKDTVNARELHEFLDVGTRFNDWITQRINKYNFIDFEDFITVTEKKVTAQGNVSEYKNYYISIDMAKELSMVENNEKGKIARQYFIECEKLDWRLPTKEELNKMHGNLHKIGVGGFAYVRYWSSSEYSSYHAWYQNLLSGYQYNLSKNYTLRVRAVNTFETLIPENYKIGQELSYGLIFDIQGGIIFICKKEDEEGTYTWDEAMELFNKSEVKE